MHLIAALLIVSPSALLLAQAQSRIFTADPTASAIHITLATTREVVHGTFHLQSGTIHFTPGEPQMSGTVTALSATGETGNGARDKRMKNSILQAPRYAEISFTPTSYTGTVAPTGDSTIQAAGTFTLLGTPHPLTIPLHIHLDGSIATATAHFAVPYVEWGLKDPSFLVWKADKTVSVDLDLTGHVSP